MGETIVHLEEVREWETLIFRRVCEQGQREAVANLDELEDALFQQIPHGWGGSRISGTDAGDTLWRSAYSSSVVSR